ncbi:hypothetical protein [Gluconobacter roseus]|uniref:Uncharacterized protein n=1 Tax=Gluconobacter roseus NBRC 3990 TaxID=1307950 RepID=A0A4Y3M4F0_9PROT|nr:hypothetical protein [Gluconobacter roseus]GBR47884.1 hypothetical protein AA3990_1925 [Gluconobacter roseus NBRC 3990]GEB03494.1 hypothetical protein GRO01_10700 [Gluconobacter roseus NBRC 3990]GLP93949.1 hypothetical protein GCM10007871_19270 [Gluconobacter roseus NBRC 3990]
MIHIPGIGMVFGPIWNRLQKKLFLKTFLWSQDRYNDWRRMGKYWKNIDEMIEYDFRVENEIFCQDSLPFNKIIFRKNKFFSADYFSILIEAQSGNIKFQEHIEIKNMDDSIYYFSLPNIPLMWIDIHEDAYCTQRLDGITVIIAEAKYKEESVAKNVKGPTYRPSGIDILNDKWVEKWEKWWNLRAIEECKRNIKLFIQYNFVTSYKIYHVNAKEMNNTKRNILLLRGMVIFYIANHMLSPIFWISVWLGKRDFWDRCE